MKMTTIPNIKFNNDLDFPILGLGTWQSPADEVIRAVEYAIDAGYRHFDCAFIYGNEKDVGIGLKNKLQEGKVQREDLYITSKLWNTFHRPDLVEVNLRLSLNDLGLDYLDLYLIHTPTAFKEDGELGPVDEHGQLQYSDVDYVDTWKAMEKLVSAGLVKSIGVSNFNQKQLERVLKVATIPPVTNQVECHPYFNQKQLLEFCDSNGIKITAYSPLGSPNRPGANPDYPVLLKDDRLKTIGAKYGKTIAQVALRYQIQRGVIVIPKSVNKSRIEENCNIFDFELSQEDMNYIDTFDGGVRYL